MVHTRKIPCISTLLSASLSQIWVVCSLWNLAPSWGNCVPCRPLKWRLFLVPHPTCMEPGGEECPPCSSQSFRVNFLLLPSKILPFVKHMPPGSPLHYPALLQSPVPLISFLKSWRLSLKFHLTLTPLWRAGLIKWHWSSQDSIKYIK